MARGTSILHRLRRDRDVRRVLTEGRRWQDRLLVVRAVRRPDYTGIALGVIVPGGWARATERTRIRRWIRESVRQIVQREQTSPGWWVAVIPRRGATNCDHASVHASLESLLREAGVVTAERMKEAPR